MALCYRDTTFCVAGDNCQSANQCRRYMSEDEKVRAQAWATSYGLDYAPVAWSDYSKRCEYYIPIDKDWKWEGFNFD